MTHLGEVLDAFSGCKNIQTTEASKEQQAQPPAPPGVGKGSSLILSTMGKRRKPHKPQISGLTGPNQENSGAHCGVTAAFGYNRVPHFVSKG